LAISTGKTVFASGAKSHKLSGLVIDHAYALLKAVEVKDKKDNIRKLMKLRNPWGRFEWNGKWSDKSDEWTPELKKTLGWSDADDGIFWIEFSDALNYYESVSICRLMKHWRVRQWELSFTKFKKPNKNNNEDNNNNNNKNNKNKEKEEKEDDDDDDDEKEFTLALADDYFDGIFYKPSAVFQLSVTPGARSVRVLASVHQEDVRHVKSHPYTDLAIYIAQVELNEEDEEEEITAVHTLALAGPKADRDLFSKEIEIKEGCTYYMIPVSWGTRLKEKEMSEKKFMLRLNWNEKGKLRVAKGKFFFSLFDVVA